jgi:hypothetical protein
LSGLYSKRTVVELEPAFILPLSTALVVPIDVAGFVETSGAVVLKT